MNHNDVGRMSKTRGVTTTFDFHPEVMTTRLKNNVVKMLQRRHINGTYTSQSRRISEMCNDKFGLGCGISTWRGIRVDNWDVKAMQEELLEIVKADWAAYCLTGKHHSDWYKRENELTRHNIINGVQGFKLSLINGDYQSKLIDVFAKTHAADEAFQKRLAIALAALNGTEPIRITQLETR